MDLMMMRDIIKFKKMIILLIGINLLKLLAKGLLDRLLNV
jgi:hypothetical protein